MQVSASVRAVQVPETNPMHPQFTTIYLVGRDQVLTIDSGADEERYRWMLRGYLAATEKAEIGQCALTHFHSDHSANIRWLCEEFNAAGLISPETAERLEAASLPPRTARLDDGTVLSPNGGIRLQTLHTPGHSSDSTCFYLEDEGVLFTDDTILGGSSTAVQDLAAYMQSLRRLRALPNLRAICPGHGPIMDRPVEWIDEYIKHREERERQVVEQLSNGEALTSWQIMERIYSVDPRLRRMADRNVRSHLEKLDKEGRIRVHAGKSRVLTDLELAEREAEQGERLAVMRRADEYREQDRRRALMLQESPPVEEWLEPPRFELA
jgi:ribonuclease/clavin/mitogillin